MMTLIFSTFKLAVLTVAVLVLSQVPVNNRRICDHVGDVMSMAKWDLKKPLAWIGKNFDFTGDASANKRSGQKSKAQTTSASTSGLSEISDIDRDALSGLLKATRSGK